MIYRCKRPNLVYCIFLEKFQYQRSILSVNLHVQPEIWPPGATGRRTSRMIRRHRIPEHRPCPFTCPLCKGRTRR